LQIRAPRKHMGPRRPYGGRERICGKFLEPDSGFAPKNGTKRDVLLVRRGVEFLLPKRALLRTRRLQRLLHLRPCGFDTTRSCAVRTPSRASCAKLVQFGPFWGFACKRSTVAPAYFYRPNGSEGAPFLMDGKKVLKIAEGTIRGDFP